MSIKLDVPAFIQQKGDTCGICSVAMVVSYFQKKTVSEATIEKNYGYHLLTALKNELPSEHYVDFGNFSGSWADIEKVLTAGKPVIIGLNGEFSVSGRGHIVVITGFDGETIYYNDPADGQRRTTTKARIAACPAHPDGKFLFMYDSDMIQIIREKLPQIDLNLHSGRISLTVPETITLEKGKTYYPNAEKISLKLTEA